MSKNLLVMGLAETGKTTFIAALWAYLTGDIEDKELILNSLRDSEHEYLNNITKKWMQFDDLPRNRDIGKPKEILMNLTVTATRDIFDLDIPDFAGETFREHFDSRSWESDYDQRLQKATGILLFVSPYNPNNHSVLIADAVEITQLFATAIHDTNQDQTLSTGGNAVPPTPSSINGSINKPYQHEYTSNQVKIVEELQFIAFHHPEILPIKIALIISAWDTIEYCENVTILPEEWLTLQMPLLHQYLNCNQDKFHFDCFGVSAQGVDYENKKLTEEMYSKSPEERIIIRYGNEKSNKITKPILWVIE